MTQVLTIPTPATLMQSLEFGIAAWIHEKFGHDGEAACVGGGEEVSERAKNNGSGIKSLQVYL